VLESVRNTVFGGNDGRRLRDVFAEDLGFDEPGEPDCKLVADELLGRDLEDLCGVIVSMWNSREWFFWYLRSISSRVSCFVSRTKQKIMPQAIRFKPA
jgi:hypothetical protein